MVLIIFTCCGHLGCAHSASLAAGREDHEKVLAFEERLALDDREGTCVIGHPVEDSPPDVLVHHLAAAKHDRHFHLLACFQELPQTLELGLEIVLGHLRPQLHLLELDDVLLAPLLLLALYGLELESSPVHAPADRRGPLCPPLPAALPRLPP